MLNHTLAYSYSPTVGAMQDGHQVIIGGDLNDFAAMDMRSVSPQVLEAFNQIGKGIVLGDILAAMQEPHRGNFEAALTDFARRGFVEPKDAKSSAIARSGELGVDYDRFDRQINLFKHQVGTYDGALEVQSKLTNASVALIGLGGCGSYIFYTLAAMGIGMIRAVEFDKVERSNLARQILYTHEDIGRNKVDVAAEKGPQISPTTKFEFVNRQLLTVDDCREVFTGVNLVISAADMPRPEFYSVVNQACFNFGVPTMYAGSMTSNAVIGPLLVPGKTRCRACIQGPDQKPRDQNHQFVNTILDGYMTTLIDPYNAAAGSISALEAVKFLTGFQQCRILGRRMIISFDDYRVLPATPVHTGPCSICN